MVIGIGCLWFGSALLWVAGHGITSSGTGFRAIWSEILSGISGEPV
jgi:hypothetical protein